MDLSTLFHFSGRSYAVRIADEASPPPRTLVSVTCLKEDSDGPDWLERVQWPDDDAISGFFGLRASFFTAGEGENEALYSVGAS